MAAKKAATKRSKKSTSPKAAETETPTTAHKDDATGAPLAIPPADHPQGATQVRTNSDGARTGSV
jgi:hypothetical protein